MWMPGPLKKSVDSASRKYPLSDAEPPTKSIRKRKILPMQIMPGLFKITFVFALKVSSEVSVL